VGRIVVGRPGGPGICAADYCVGQAGAQDWLPVPEAARQSFPAVDVILRQRVVRHGDTSSSRHAGITRGRSLSRARSPLALPQPNPAPIEPAS
jgi:hypothetical protein